MRSIGYLASLRLIVLALTNDGEMGPRMGAVTDSGRVAVYFVFHPPLTLYLQFNV
jgi:hypothetical protein